MVHLKFFLSIQIDSTIFVVFLTYFVIPLSLRVATGLSVILTMIHLLIVTAVPYATPGEVLARQVFSVYPFHPVLFTALFSFSVYS